MTTEQSIAFASTESPRNGAPSESEVDPFYLYLDLVREVGEGRVYLLDAAKDSAAPQYQKSILGISPVLEVMVKDNDIALVLVSGLEHVFSADVSTTFIHRPQETNGLANTPSAVEGTRLYYHSEDPMGFLEQLRVTIRERFGSFLDPSPFSSGFLGYLGYDSVHYLEALPKTTLDDRGLPDLRLQWHAITIQLSGSKIEHFSSLEGLSRAVNPVVAQGLQGDLRSTLAAIANRVADPLRLPALLSDVLEEQTSPEQSADVVEDVSQAEYEENVRRAIEYIRAGDIFQVVISKRARVEKRLHHYVVYDRLRRLNPSPYMFMSEYPDMRLFGTSPEVQFRVVGAEAEMRPIAGTSKGRGATQEEDQALVDKLLSDEKEQAEHVMLVDLCRNDLGRVCKINSVRVPMYLTAERYSHVIHLVSSVVGVLRDDVSVFHALLATFPAGTLSGAPKIRAMEIIDELERVRRGPYGGLIGMVDFQANANTAIVIRSVVESGNEYFVQAGAGIVADSSPTEEWKECGRKLGALLQVLVG